MVMSATEHAGPLALNSRRYWRRLLVRLRVSRIMSVALAVAAVIAVSGTYAAMRGILPFSSEPGQVLIWFYADLVVLLLLALLIGWRVVALWVDRRRGSAGSRLHVRMVRMFGFVSVVPAIIVTISSVLFFNFGLESWLSGQVRTALEESVAVAEAYLHEHKQNIRADVLAMAKDLNSNAIALENNPDLFNRVVDFQSRLRELSEAIVFDESGEVLARSGLTYLLEVDPVPTGAVERARRKRGRGPGSRPRAAGRFPRSLSLCGARRRSQGAGPYDENARRGRALRAHRIQARGHAGQFRHAVHRGRACSAARGVVDRAAHGDAVVAPVERADRCHGAGPRRRPDRACPRAGRTRRDRVAEPRLQPDDGRSRGKPA
jgi:hypothetical protein